jgi:hypothetical protein
VSGLHHVGVRPRSLRYYTTERHTVMPARFRFTPESGHVQCNSASPLCANSGHFTSQLYHPMQSQLAIKQTGTMLRAIPRTGVAGLAQITIQSDSRPL